MLIYTRVTDWRIDSGTRVNSHLCPTGNQYLLNHAAMFDIHELPDGAWMYYFDNPLDVKCGGAYLKSTNTVAELIARADYTPDHENGVLIPHYIDNVLTNDVENYYVPMAYISRAWPYDIRDSSAAYTWIVYAYEGWDLRKVLCQGSFDSLVAYVNATVV